MNHSTCNFRRRVFALIATAMTIQPLVSAYGAGVNTYGLGGATCKDFLRARTRDPNAEALFFFWAQGYLTAANVSRQMEGKRLIDLAPIGMQEAGAKGFILDTCRNHPDFFYVMSVETLLVSLRVTQDIRD